MTARQDPFIVRRFDVAMEPAPEEKPFLTIGAVTIGGHPVALLLDPEDRAKVGGWLLPELVEEVSRLRAERHSTNEALSDAAEQLRVQRDRIAELEALTPAPIQTCQTCGAGYDLGQPCSVCSFHVLMEIAQKKQRQLEDPHDGPNHHDYALGRDLPFIPGQTTGRCPKGHTFEDCTCGGGR
jgi:hypothetical protein